jgi:hypothetical protein
VKQFHRHHEPWSKEFHQAQQMNAITRMPDQKVMERWRASFMA